jgi:anaphase-promoting complex subunit 3
VVEVDKFSPETWCVVGNCFSLQREPDVAIKFFQRALQIDPSFAYAHTLCGHELVNNEDLDKAVTSFRQAVLFNDRHYNAWYGLGSLYYRQERFELAEYHFRRALAINPASSVLHCYLAMSLFAQGSVLKTDDALSVLKAACKVDPRNPQLWFQRAHILVSEGDLQGAVDALCVVREHAPKEPPVYSMLGQVYYKLGRMSDALRNINIAVDLDPKEATALKALMEQMEEAEEQDEDEEDPVEEEMS